jgi:subtilisin family serine protease
MSKITLGLLAIGLLVLSSPSKYNAMAADSSAEYRIPDKKSDKRKESKLSSQIEEALTKMKTMGIARSNIQDFKPEQISTPQVRVNDSGNIQTYIHVKEVTDENLAQLETLGVIIEIANTKHKIIQGWVPFDQLEDISNLDFVTKIAPPSYGKTRTGSVDTEGDAIIGSDDVRDMLGFDGTGVLVGVISDGVDSMAVSQGTGDLPDNIIIGNDGNGDEGTALLEIVRDIAPGADLAFSSGLSTSMDFIESIDFLVDIGADIIVDDLGFLNEPFFEDGMVAEEAEDAVEQGVVFVSAGGNDADQHYQDLYVDGGQLNEDLQNVHDFGLAAGQSSDVAMRVLIPPQQTVIFVLQWNDRFGQSSNDYNLFLFDPSTGEVIDSGTDIQNGNDDPIESAGFVNSSSSAEVDIVINRLSGQARTLEMFFNGQVTPLEFNASEDSVFGHPAVSGVIAVGAVPSNNPNAIEPFSSQGPVTISFPSESRPKPDVVAPDRVSITGAGGFPSSNPGFFVGTSASAPHVAGVVALLLDKNPNLSPAEVANILGDTAIDLGQSGFDDIFGFGRVDAFEAEQSVTEGNNGGNGNGDAGNSGCSLASTSASKDLGTIHNLFIILVPAFVVGLRRLYRKMSYTIFK